MSKKNLIKAIQTALTGSPEVSFIVDDRIYSTWAGGVAPPLIRVSIPATRDFEDDCGKGDEFDVRIFCISEDDPELQSDLVQAVKDALDDADLALDDDADLREFRYSQTLYRTESGEPTIATAVVYFTAIATTPQPA